METYWDLDKAWQQAAMLGDQKKCDEIDVKQKALYVLFDREDWAELFSYADTPEAKIGIKKLIDKYAKKM